jgi:heme-degrading monooxygenase HmoA
VVFTSLRSPADAAGYAAAAERMLELARAMPGFLGVDSARSDDGLGITVSYWQDEASIRRWREEAEHRAVQQQGRSQWYAAFELRVCRVERAYGFRREA